jgi:uncharacterized membrane protein
MKEKTQNRIQWASVLGAVALLFQQLGEVGILAPEQSIIALTVTTIVSALLPKIRGWRKAK